MNATANASNLQSRRLLRAGVLLLLLGLLTGFAVPMAANPRMALSSHLEGVLNGLLLVGLGIVFPRLVLGARARAATFGLAVYGSFANWLATLLAALWGAGVSMPIAAGDQHGTAVQEWLITGMLFTLSFAMIAVCVLVLVGLRREPEALAAGA
jgi:hydroxylaminobenzene mutase